jgi:uncharacterized membrane protein
MPSPDRYGIAWKPVRPCTSRAISGPEKPHDRAGATIIGPILLSILRSFDAVSEQSTRMRTTCDCFTLAYGSLIGTTGQVQESIAKTRINLCNTKRFVHCPMDQLCSDPDCDYGYKGNSTLSDW